jgi:flagellar M-ring protein FliF
VHLAKLGIPSFEVFQNDPIPEPRWPSEDENRIIRINYLRAIQGELSRCIEQIEDVKLARVLIFQWENSNDLEKRPKALVYLFLHRPLNAHSLNVIRQLVANTVNSQLLANVVNQMQPANVSIHDHLPLSLL